MHRVRFVECSTKVVLDGAEPKPKKMQLHQTIDELLALQAHAKINLPEITLVDLIGLSLVSRNPGIIPTKIAGSRATSTSAVTGMIDRGVTIGLFERRDNPNDRRQKQVFLTEKGAKLVQYLESLQSAQ